LTALVHWFSDLRANENKPIMLEETAAASEADSAAARERRLGASIAEFDSRAIGSKPLDELVAELILDRVPLYFDSASQFHHWRKELSIGLNVGLRDIQIIGSAATGRSLSAKSHFGVFRYSGSDIDIAVISSTHFNVAWNWFRSADPVLLGLDPHSTKMFRAHQEHYIYEGVIAAEEFLSFLPFREDWNKELARSASDLPAVLQGRRMTVRIYRNSDALMAAQIEAMRIFRKNKGTIDATR
jgi:hypothetical protein